MIGRTVNFASAQEALAALLERFDLDDRVTDINVANGQATVRRDGLSVPVDIEVSDEEIAELVALMASAMDMEVGRHQPKFSKRLPPRYRISATHPALKQNGRWGLSVRFLPVRPIPLAEYIADGAMTQGVAERILELLANKRTMLVSGGTGAGKAQPVDEPVLTPTGWRAIGALKPGDLVLGPDGRTARVRAVFPQGVRPIVRIRFRDGRTALCSEDHLWSVWSKTSRRTNGRKESVWQWRVRSAAEIARSVSTGTQYARRLGVPLIAGTGVGGTHRVLPIAPYALGVLLGDGGLSGPSTPRISNPDAAVHKRFAAALAETGHELRPVSGSEIDFHVVRRADDATASSMAVPLRALGLLGLRSHEKFVPDVYMEAQPTERLELVRGLMDTDGSVNHGALSYSTTSHQLALDVQRLIWSLGGIANLSSRTTHYTHKGERREGRRSYHLSISHPQVTALVTRPHRVAGLAATPAWRTLGLRLQVDSVEPAGSVECVCISIDREDGLYVTRDYVVTHNTTLVRALICELPRTERVVIIEDRAELNVLEHANIEALESTQEQPFEELVRHTLTLDPDRIIIGEVRGREALDVIDAGNSGHEGLITSIHSNGRELALTRMVRLCRRADPNFDAAEVRDAIGAVVQITLHGGRRQIELWEPGST